MSLALMIVGLTLMFFGALGVAILPDIFLRLHASTKCGVTGTATFLLGLILRAGSPGTAARLGLILLFIFLTAPLVPHIVGVAYLKEREAEQEPRT